MPPVSFSDEEMRALTTLASALPRVARGEFLQCVANKLSEHPVRGDGLTYRIATEVQRSFLRDGFVAVGLDTKRSGKYGRSPRERRRERD